MSGAGSITNVHYLEVLLRAHVMMATVHGRGSTEHQELLIVAMGYCLLIWKVHVLLYH